MPQERRVYGRFTIVLMLVSAGLPLQVTAAPADVRLRDYVQTTWTHRDGVPLARPQDITQTTDGYLWFVSEWLVVRFDGVRFVQVQMPCERVRDLAPGDDGSLWILCGERRLQLFQRSAAGLLSEVALTHLDWTNEGGAGLFRDRRGRIWVHGSVLARLESNGTFRQLTGNFDGHIRDMVEDLAGTIWLTTGQLRVIRLRDDRLEDTPILDVAAFAAAPSAGVFACGRDGIRHLTGTGDTVIARASAEVSFVQADGCLGVDASGAVWAATRQNGIARIQGGRVETSLARNELGGSTTHVFVDREDTIWVGSAAGLHRFRKPHARLLSLAVAAVPANPVSAFVDSRDGLWIGSDRQFIRVNLASGTSEVFAGLGYRAVGEDERGRIWLATEGEIGYLEGRSFRRVRDVTGASVSNVWSFTKDRDGHLWAVAEAIGIYRVTPGLPQRVFDEPKARQDFLVSARHGVWVTLAGGGVKQYVGDEPIVHDTKQGQGDGYVLALFEDGDAIWMGGQWGLLRWRKGGWTKWTRAHGLPSTGAVHEITRDRLGRLWLMTSGGILVLSREALDATPDGAPQSLQFVQISRLDRVVPHQGPPATSPRVSMDRDGRLYFATIDSVAVVDPAAVTPSSLRPIIVIESVAADNQPVDTAAAGRLVAPSRLQFGYTSLSLRSPENSRFRYRLENYDTDWIEAGTARQVTYGTLRPGSYRFHVIGSSSEGVWNEEGTTYPFQIVPQFYDTWWFRGLALAAVVTAVGGIHQLRVRRLTRTMQIRFEERVAERTRIARDLHDTLLQSFQGVLIHFQAATNLLPGRPDAARLKLESVLEQAAGAVTEGRDAVQAMRESAAASDDLPRSLTTLADQLIADHHDADRAPTIHVNVEGSPRSLHPIVRDDVYRIAGEAMRNAVHHAQAREIQVDIHYESKSLQLRIRDDGVGIDAIILEGRGVSGHWGLPGMRERAELIGGTLDVRSRVGAGTEVELSLPAAKAYAAPHGRPRFWSRRSARTTARMPPPSA